MATTLQLRADIKKLKGAIASKSTPKSVLPKLKSQLEKVEKELADKKAGKKTKSTRAATQATLGKLQTLVSKSKKLGIYRGSSESNLQKDAERPALAVGRRVSKGLRANQSGSKSDNKGNVYYEYRRNRLDVKQPKKKQKYPILEEGGIMAEGGVVGIATTYGKMLNELNKEKQFNKKIEKKAQVDKFAKNNDITIDSNNIISIKGEKIAYIDKINQKTGQEKSNWEIKKYADGGYMAKGGDTKKREEIEEAINYLHYWNIEGKISPNHLEFVRNVVKKYVNEYAKQKI